MKKTITKPEVKVMKLQKMNVIATSGGGNAPKMRSLNLEQGTNNGAAWRNKFN